MTPDSAAIDQHAEELARGERFAFGENWRRFLTLLNEKRIAKSVASLRQLLQVESLEGKTFLDVGSGSGLSSLAAHKLGATVISFDYDPSSVACTQELRSRFGADGRWEVMSGSALDAPWLATLGTFDVVYSWGVLHHTGAMWTAIGNTLPLVKPGGRLAIAIYNDQGEWSRRWARIKRFYCSGPAARAVVNSVYIPYQVLRGLTADVLWRRNPLARYRGYGEQRGMSVLYDWFDWLGGYPFEVAKPEAVFHFVEQRGFRLTNLTTCGGSVGCNEFVFERERR